MGCNSATVSGPLQSKYKKDSRENCREQANDYNGNGDPGETRLVKILGRGTFLVRAELICTSINYLKEHSRRVYLLS